MTTNERLDEIKAKLENDLEIEWSAAVKEQITAQLDALLEAQLAVAYRDYWSITKPQE